MNNFAIIEHVQRFNKVNFYTVKIEKNEISLFDQFISKHTNENYEKLNHILTWIKIIGNKYSARSIYFRN